MPYLNIDLVKTRKLDLDEVERVAAQAASTQEHIGRVYTRRDLLAGEVQRDEIGRAFGLGFYGPRSGDLRILQNLTIYSRQPAHHTGRPTVTTRTCPSFSWLLISRHDLVRKELS